MSTCSKPSKNLRRYSMQTRITSSSSWLLIISLRSIYPSRFKEWWATALNVCLTALIGLCLRQSLRMSSEKVDLEISKAYSKCMSRRCTSGYTNGLSMTKVFRHSKNVGLSYLGKGRFWMLMKGRSSISIWMTKLSWQRRAIWSSWTKR